MRRFILLVAFVSILLPAAVRAEGIEVKAEAILLEDGPGEGLQATPAAAFGKDAYLVLWREGWHGRGGDSRIYAARVDTSGTVLDAKGIEIAPSEEGVQSGPRVAFGGGVFLVVWQDFRNGADYDILAARVSADGKVLDTKPIAVAAGPRTQVLPDVASDGKSFMVVWQGLKDKEAGYRGFAAPVGADGKVGAVVETGASPQPRIAWGGENYLTVFGTGHLMGTRLDAAGAPLAENRNSRLVVNWKHSIFSVAGAPGTGWLVLDHRSPPDYWGWGGPGAIRSYFVRSNGTLDPGITKEPAGVKSKQPNWLDIGLSKKDGATWPMDESAVAWDGKQFIAVWQRYHLEKVVMFADCDIIASRVDGFKPLDPDGVKVAAAAEREMKPTLASTGAGNLLCAYERYGADGKVRVAARVLVTVE